MAQTNDLQLFGDTGIQKKNYWKDHGYFKENHTYSNITVLFDPLGGHSIWQVIVIVLLTGSLSLVTVVGNILVLVSFKVNKVLKTVNNYYLLSLAFADLTIGTLSMNLYTTYMIMGTWALGNWACDIWLAIDYVASNASVMNLLVISFDRYFSVTKPLTYRAKRTTKRAMAMICSAWIVSFVLWAPAILFWQFIVGKRTVPPGECYIQFLSEPIITFCTAVAAYYLPVTIMTVLFWRIYRETENRSKGLAGLKGSGNQTEKEISFDIVQIGNLQKSSSVPMKTIIRQKPHKWRNCINCYRREMVNIIEDEQQKSHPDLVNVAHFTLSIIDQNMSVNVDCTGTRATQDLSESPSLTKSLKDNAVDKVLLFKANKNVNQRKKQSGVREKKAAQTLSAILLAFLLTWTPYNIMVLVNTFCDDCIPETLWSLGYWLCYVNSTINPMCYALCNKNFRDTFKMLLLCQWKLKKEKTLQCPRGKTSTH